MKHLYFHLKKDRYKWNKIGEPMACSTSQQ